MSIRAPSPRTKASALTAHIVDGPCHGCLHRNDDGSYTYVPQNEWFGADSFSYYVIDSEAESNVATIHIQVVPMPTAENAQFRVNSDGTVNIDLRRLVDDPDENAEASLAISVNVPGHGQLIRKDNGVYIYKPDSSFTGIDTFTYTVSDGTYSATATITLSVRKDDDDGCWKGYSGEDAFVIEVEKYGIKIDIHYTIEVPDAGESPNGLCTMDHWMISRVEVEMRRAPRGLDWLHTRSPISTSLARQSVGPDSSA